MKKLCTIVAKSCVVLFVRETFKEVLWDVMLVSIFFHIVNYIQISNNYRPNRNIFLNNTPTNYDGYFNTS